MWMTFIANATITAITSGVLTLIGFRIGERRGRANERIAADTDLGILRAQLLAAEHAASSIEIAARRSHESARQSFADENERMVQALGIANMAKERLETQCASLTVELAETRAKAAEELAEERQRALAIQREYGRFVSAVAAAARPRSVEALADLDISDPPSLAEADRATVEAVRMRADQRRDRPLDGDRRAVRVADDSVEPVYRAHDPEEE